MLVCFVCGKAPSRELAKGRPGRESILPMSCECGSVSATGGPSLFSWYAKDISPVPAIGGAEVMFTSEGKRILCGGSWSESRNLTAEEAGRMVRAIVAKTADLSREYAVRKILES